MLSTVCSKYTVTTAVFAGGKEGVKTGRGICNKQIVKLTGPVRQGCNQGCHELFCKERLRWSLTANLILIM